MEATSWAYDLGTGGMHSVAKIHVLVVASPPHPPALSWGSWGSGETCLHVAALSWGWGTGGNVHLLLLPFSCKLSWSLRYRRGVLWSHHHVSPLCSKILSVVSSSWIDVSCSYGGGEKSEITYVAILVTSLFSFLYFSIYPIKTSCFLPPIAVLQMESIHFMKC